MYRILFISFVISCCSTLLFCEKLSQNQYDKIVSYLNSQGIIVGVDISVDEVSKIINAPNVIMNDGKVNYSSVDKRLLSLLNFKQENFANINNKLKQNPNHPINKEVTGYFKDNNDRIDKTKAELTKKDDDGWFSKTVNYILDIMKF